MRFLRSMAAGVMTTMMVMFGIMVFLYNRAARGEAAVSISMDVWRLPLLQVPLVVAFVLGFGLAWWNLRPD